MSEGQDIILQLRDMKTHFAVRQGVFKRVTGHVKAVDGINLDIYRGEVLGLVGESGCGKTTLGKSLLQLIRPTDGQITYHGTDGAVEMRGLTDEEMVAYRKKLQIVIQDPHSSLNPAFTIFDSLEDPLKKYGVKSKKERRKTIGDLLEAVNLRREYMDRYPHEFSGGQRQRIAIARALSSEPDVIILDEPTSALDISIQAQILNLLKELQRDRGLTYVFISHDISVVRYFCDEVAVMYLGQVVESGPVDEVLRESCHPYTSLLLDSIPRMSTKADLGTPLSNTDLPSNRNLPSHCFFYDRCDQKSELCQNVQVLSPVSGRADHLARCRLAEGVDCSEAEKVYAAAGVAK